MRIPANSPYRQRRNHGEGTRRDRECATARRLASKPPDKNEAPTRTPKRRRAPSHQIGAYIRQHHTAFHHTNRLVRDACGKSTSKRPRHNQQFSSHPDTDVVRVLLPVHCCFCNPHLPLFYLGSWSGIQSPEMSDGAGQGPDLGRSGISSGTSSPDGLDGAAGAASQPPTSQPIPIAPQLDGQLAPALASPASSASNGSDPQSPPTQVGSGARQVLRSSMRSVYDMLVTRSENSTVVRVGLQTTSSIIRMTPTRVVSGVSPEGCAGRGT